MREGFVVKGNNDALRLAEVGQETIEGTGKIAEEVEEEHDSGNHEEPVALMKEALRVLKPNGMLAVIHWNYDPTTPRGPAMDIRPRPEQCIEWGKKAGFRFKEQNRFDIPPYHYGLLFKKPFT